MGKGSRVGDPVKKSEGLPVTIGIITVFSRSVSHLVQHFFLHVNNWPLCLEMHALTMLLSRWTFLLATSPSPPHPSLVCVNKRPFSCVYSRCDVPLMTLPTPISVLKGPRPLDESNLGVELL